MKQVRTAVVATLLLAASWAIAAPSSVKMEGKTLPQEFVGQMTQSERLKEYIPANETFERWTRLMGLRLQNAAQIKNLYSLFP